METTVDVGYDEDAKALWGKVTTKEMKVISRLMPLKKVSVKWNKAGIACSGEVTLIGMYDDNRGVYITASTPSFHGLMFRTVKHMEDWSGGPNQWIDTSEMTTEDIAKQILKGTL